MGRWRLAFQLLAALVVFSLAFTLLGGFLMLAAYLLPFALILLLFLVLPFFF